MSDESESRGSPWTLRILVAAALTATIWFAGPKAYAVFAQKLRGPSPIVDLSHVGVRTAPEWLRDAGARPILERVLLDLEALLRGDLLAEDTGAFAAFRDRVAACPWVAAARYPGLVGGDPSPRVGVELDLRRPELAVVDADSKIAWLVAADGVVLPPPVRPLDADAMPRFAPHTDIDSRRFRAGRGCRDAFVLEAAAVAHEWRTAVRPRVVELLEGDGGAPLLLEVDASNLGGAFLGDPRYSEVAIALGDRDGRPVWFQFGRSAARGGVIDVATKAEVLAEVLRFDPDLRRVTAGDLRLRNRWRDCLVLRAPDGAGRDDAERIGREPTGTAPSRGR